MDGKTNSVLEIVVPCYNERDVLADTSEQLLSVLTDLIERRKISATSSLMFVDDGSSDDTWEIILSQCERFPQIGALKLSGNRGHQNALLAGMLTSSADFIITIDADLQDDVSKISEMVDQHVKGHEIVYGVRQKRDSDSFFKRKTATLYYRLLRQFGVNIIYNHADFRLLGRKAINALAEYKEVNVFLRGLVPSLGFSFTTVSYDRIARTQGETKYPLRRMVGFALSGITSHSMFPLRLIAFLGISIFFITLGLSLWTLWIVLFSNDAVPGWASSVLPMYLLGGLQLFGLGVVGEYIGKIYLETKERPRYLIEQTIVPQNRKS